MDHRRGAGLRDHVEAVAEREERVGRAHGAGRLEADLTGAHDRQARGVHAIHLARADPDDLAAGRQDDRVRFDVLGHAPGEAERVQLGGRRPTLRDGLERGGVQIGQVGLLGEQATEDAPVFRESSGQARPIAGDLEHAALLLRAPERGERVGCERRGEEDLDEDPGERLHDAHVEGTVHADDAAVDRDRVARLGPGHRLADRGAEGDAAGIRVLDDHRRRLVELQHDGERRREVEEVVVAERRAVELPHRPEPVARPVEGRVERRRLVRVLPVAEPEGALGVDPEPERPRLRGRGRRHRRLRGPQIARDRRVVLGRAPERVLGEAIARGVGERAAPPKLVEHAGVLGRVGHDADARVVLRRGADHRGTTDVDLLDRLVERDPGPRHRRLEGVERDDDEIDRRDPVLVERFEVTGDVPPRQNAGVDHRVKRLDTAVEHLGEPGDVGDVAHGDSVVPQELRGAAGRDDLDPQSTEGAGELDHAGLVVDGDEDAADLHRTVTHHCRDSLLLLINLAGVLACFIGVIFTYRITAIALGYTYRILSGQQVAAP